MKSRPSKLTEYGYIQCAAEEATHLTIHIPGPSGELTLPVMIKGSREGTGNWSWNGDVDKPTLRPSVLTQGTRYQGGDVMDKANHRAFRCHTWITDGQAIFLDDTDHDLREKTVDLVDVTNEVQTG